MWLGIFFVSLILIAVDTIVRAILMFRLDKKVEQKGDYRQRHHEIGAGTKQFVITLLGASSMYGEGSDMKIPFVDGLVKVLVKQGHKVIVHNLAISGHRVTDVTTKQVPLMGKSDLILVYAGTKDCLTLTSTRQYLSVLHRLAESLHGQTVMWITIGDPRFMWLLPLWLRWLFHFRAKKFSCLLKEMVAANSSERWSVVDFFTKGRIEARQRGLSSKQVLSDGFHLSNEGQRMVSDMIVEVYMEIAEIVNQRVKRASMPITRRP